MKLRVLKPLSYMSRRMIVGEEFEAAKERDVRVLLATRKVEKVRAEAPVPPPPPAVVEKIEETFVNPLAEARAAYEEKFGKRPYYGWDEATLREKMAEAD